MSGANKHPYHLVEASPWPAVGSAAAFTAAIGGVMYMHEVAYGVAVLGLGFALVLATMFMWWRDIVREAEYQGTSHTDRSDWYALWHDAVYRFRGNVLCRIFLGVF
jgi:hypothetical protein